jgi:hypothetical protein
LIAESGAPKPQLAVDNRAEVADKSLHHVKNSTGGGDILRFYAYICHAIDHFTCLELQHQGSENLAWQNPEHQKGA